jgi:hypothetical protein
VVFRDGAHIVIEVTLCISNEAARSTRAELRRMLNGPLADKIAGEKRDKNDTASLAYVILHELKAKLDVHIARLDDNERADKARRQPPIRKTWE